MPAGKLLFLSADRGGFVEKNSPVRKDNFWVLFKQLASRDFKLKFAGSVFGVAWALVMPLVLTLVLTFVFTRIMGVRDENFSLLVLCALLPWFWFSLSLSESCGAVLHQRRLFAQFNIPKLLLPLASMSANFFNFLIGWIFVVIFVLMGRAFSGPAVFCLVGLIVLQQIFIFGLGFIFSSLNALFRDTAKILEIVLLLWFWVTPVFYPVSQIPADWRWVILMNPMTHFVEAYRDILLRGLLPQGREFYLLSSVSLFSLGLGLVVFRRLEPALSKRIA